MKIVQVHNYYQQAGGEDAVVAAELALLRDLGHEVIPFYKSNEALGAGLWVLAKASLQTLWSWDTYREFRKLLRAERSDVVHCHNTFPLISPSIYWACAKERVPVVQTLHNYRLLCLNALLFRQSGGVKSEGLSIRPGENLKPKNLEPKTSASGGICEKCIQKRFKWPGIKYGCYRDSRAGSLVVAMMLFVHKRLGTWMKKVTAYIALTEFQKQKMVQGGFPEDKIFVKPNFIADGAEVLGLGHQVLGGNLVDEKSPFMNNENTPAPYTPHQGPGAQCPMPSAPYCLFVGRLSPEKGCDVLIRAWVQFQANLTPNAQCSRPFLLIVGDGPEREKLEHLVSTLMPSAQSPMPDSIRFLGKQLKEDVFALMRCSKFLVLPSVWYEGFPMTIVEAFSNSLPVLASDAGGMSTIIMDGENGLKFNVADSDALAEKIEWAFAHLDQIRAMGVKARREFDALYSAEANGRQLVDIYRKSMGLNEV